MHMQKSNVKDLLVQKIEWKQTERRTYTADRIILSANAVGIKWWLNDQHDGL